MGKCSNCGVKIQYNKFKMYRGKVLCYECYGTRLARKKQKKLEAEAKLAVEDIKKTSEEFGAVKTTEEEDKSMIAEPPEDAIDES